MNDDARHVGFWPGIACVLILLTPFVLLLDHEDYGYFGAEVLAILAGLGLAGGVIGLVAGNRGRFIGASIAAILLVLFIDLQFDWITAWNVGIWGPLVLAFGAAWTLRHNIWPVLAAVFATVIVSTLLVPDDHATSDFSRSEPPSSNAGDLPIVMHLILDEHAGIEAIPVDLKGGSALRERLRTWYREHGFVLYGRAYSQYIDSVDSISHALSFASTPTDGLVRQTWRHRGESGFHWRMPKNEYFERLAREGYRVHVYQSQFLDLCGENRGAVTRCVTYPLGFGSLRNSTMSRTRRIHVIGSVLLSRSFLYSQLRAAYNLLAQTARGRELGLPAWAWERERVEPISVETTMRRLVGDVAAAVPGDAFVSHLLIPHDPYVYDSDCRLRRPSTWLARSMFNEIVGLTPAKRSERYDRYFAQVHCLYRRLDAIMGAIESSQFASRFVVILHGDHGARLGLRYPKFGHGESLKAVDYQDNYATLFAVRIPGGTAGYRSDVRSVQEMLGAFARNGFEYSALEQNRSISNRVYIASSNERHYPVETCAMLGFEQGRPSGPSQATGNASGRTAGGTPSNPSSRDADCQTLTRQQAKRSIDEKRELVAMPPATE